MERTEKRPAAADVCIGGFLMAKKYNIKYNGRSVEMTKPNSTMIVYKIPYADIEKKKIGVLIPNQFIVYILYGSNPHGKDMIYVGKSKNGIASRPTSHKNKYEAWTTCFILTQFKERTFFNDGTIQYLEDNLNKRIDEVGMYHNTTVSTTSGTANKDDEEDCDDYLQEAYLMLDILGLDLITHSEEAEAEDDIAENDSAGNAANRAKIPNGLYYFARKIKRMNGITLHGIMEVKDGSFILKAGSEVAQEEGIGLAPNVELLRNNTPIENGKLLEDVVMNSPSACGEFIVGASCNGWTNWKTKDGQAIDIYRKG